MLISPKIEWLSRKSKASLLGDFIRLDVRFAFP